MVVNFYCRELYKIGYWSIFHFIGKKKIVTSARFELGSVELRAMMRTTKSLLWLLPFLLLLFVF